ncbi:MAG: NUDIX hydrolase [Halieaceae bacterium]|jgi:ADP-ribose pyrophosphatase YjhB (NUDIX family)|nr:NUDIX hydrolase [Halieaceae bacterium]
MKFCSTCGANVELRVPEGDDRNRFVCVACDVIHYVNPRVIVGCLATHGERVLLCRRAIEPRYGLWTLPAGFMENGETTKAGAARETWEEACGRVSDLELYRVFDVPYISQVYLFYRCSLDEGRHAAGPESLETALFEEGQIPWDEIAFPVVKNTLEDFFADRREGRFPIVVDEIAPPQRARPPGS